MRRLPKRNGRGRRSRNQLLPDRFKTLFREGSGQKPAVTADQRALENVPLERPSRGLEQFFFNIRDMTGLSILDLGGAVQQNIEFITSLGHRITTQAFLQTLDHTFGERGFEEQSVPSIIDSFLTQNLAFPDASFDGVLVWDTLQYMSPALLTATVDELFRIMRPQSCLLGFFSTEEKGQLSSHLKFRIVDASTLALAQTGTRARAQLFNNRNLERLFASFDSVKFFLNRENLREVIVRR